MIDETLVEWVHFDLRHWPPSQRLDREVPTDVFSPNTLAHLREVLAKDHRAQELIAMAETPNWSQQTADELFSHLQSWLARKYKDSKSQPSCSKNY